MITFLFELLFLLLPKLTFVFEIIVGSILSLLFLPDYINNWFPYASYSIAFEIGYWLYYALMATVAIVFLIQNIRKLPEITKSTQAHFDNLTYKHWVCLGIVIFLILFPGIMAANSTNFIFGDTSGIGFSIFMTLFFFVIAGHAVVVVFVVFALKNLVWRYAKYFKPLNKLLLLIPPQLGRAARTLILVYPLIVGFTSVGWFLTEGSDSAQAGKFFVVNAAIKNTCFIDPTRENCPKTLEEVSYIEPSEYKMMTDCCQVHYQYNPEINQYSLVVRYTPTRAVIFDWRLVTPEYQLDFKEYEVAIIGQDQLVNPPPWDGPWEFEDWDYLGNKYE